VYELKINKRLVVYDMLDKQKFKKCVEVKDPWCKFMSMTKSVKRCR